MNGSTGAWTDKAVRPDDRACDRRGAHLDRPFQELRAGTLSHGVGERVRPRSRKARVELVPGDSIA